MIDFIETVSMHQDVPSIVTYVCVYKYTANIKGLVSGAILGLKKKTTQSKI